MSNIIGFIDDSGVINTNVKLLNLNAVTPNGTAAVNISGSIDTRVQSNDTSEKANSSIKTILTNVTDGQISADMAISLSHNNNLNEIVKFESGAYNDTIGNKLALINSNASDADYKRKSTIAFRGKKSGETDTHDMAYIEGSHSGTGADKKGQIIFKVNDGNDADGALSTIMSIGPSTEVHNGVVPDLTGITDASNQIRLDEGASGTVDAYNDKIINITGGTGSGQVRKITDYVETSKIATVDSAWDINPDDTSTFSIYTATVTINGDLNINNSITSTNTEITDTLIKLGQGLTETPAKDLGIIFTRGNGTLTNTANKGLIWDESADTFAFISCNDEDGKTVGELVPNGYESLKLHKLYFLQLDLS